MSVLSQQFIVLFILLLGLILGSSLDTVTDGGLKLSKDVSSLNSSELNKENVDLQQNLPEDTVSVEESQLNNSSFESIIPKDELTNQNDSSNFLENSDSEKTSPDLASDSDDDKTSPDLVSDSDDDKTSPDLASDSDDDNTSPDLASDSDGDKTIFEPVSDFDDEQTLSDSIPDSKDNKTSLDLKSDFKDDLTLPDSDDKSNDQEITSPSVADSATNKSADAEDSILNSNTTDLSTVNEEDIKHHNISRSYETVGIVVIVVIMLTVGLAIAKKRGYICSEYEDVYDRSASYQHNTTPNLGVPSEKYDPL